MIYFLHGSDGYQSNHRLKQLKSAFQPTDPSGCNQAVFDLTENDWPAVKAGILAMPFLASARQIIIKNGFGAKKKIQEDLADFLPQVPESTGLIIYENQEIDKRNVLWKRLEKLGRTGQAEVKEFPPVKGWDLIRLIESEIAAAGGQIEPAASQKLADYLLVSGWRLKQELDKLLAFAAGRAITTNDIELLIKPDFETSIFDLTDQIAGGRSRRALELLERLIEQNANELYILTMIAFQFRHLLLVKSLTEKNGYLSPGNLAQRLAIHPFVAKKALAQSQRFSLLRLKKIYQKILQTDLGIKTGRWEPRLGLELLIAKINS